MREELDIITAYNMVGSYRGAADICGATHKTANRVLQRHAAACSTGYCTTPSPGSPTASLTACDKHSNAEDEVST